MNGSNAETAEAKASYVPYRPMWTRERFAGLLSLNVNCYAVFILCNGVTLKGTIRGLADKTIDTNVIQFNFEMDDHVGPLILRPEDVVGIFVSASAEQMQSGRNLMDSLEELSVSTELLGLENKQGKKIAVQPLQPGTKVPLPGDKAKGPHGK